MVAAPAVVNLFQTAFQRLYGALRTIRGFVGTLQAPSFCFRELLLKLPGQLPHLSLSRESGSQCILHLRQDLLLSAAVHRGHGSGMRVTHVLVATKATAAAVGSRAMHARLWAFFYSCNGFRSPGISRVSGLVEANLQCNHEATTE